MKRLIVVAAFLAATWTVVGTSVASGATTPKLVGPVSCESGVIIPRDLTCTGRFAGLQGTEAGVFLDFIGAWQCDTQPSIVVGTPAFLAEGLVPVRDGRLFTVHNLPLDPTILEVILNTDFGCPGEVWSILDYRFVRLVLFLSDGTQLEYELGTFNP